jgi:protein-disulfide isomerase
MDEKKGLLEGTSPKLAFLFGLVTGVAAFCIVGLGVFAITSGNSSTNGKADNGKVLGVQDTGDTKPAAQQPEGGPQADPSKLSAVTDADHIRGDKNAKVTLIEFSDFQCPYCGRIEPTIEKVLKDYSGKVRLVYRHFPLSFHENAQKAAEASECAGDQGKFWEMHDKLYANQTALTLTDLKGYAKELGLNTSNFDSCLDSSKYASKVAAQEAEGQASGVDGTPATFVNGTLISGAVPYEQFKAAIDAALK